MSYVYLLYNARLDYIDVSYVDLFYDARVDYIDVSYLELSLISLRELCLPSLQCQGRLHRRELPVVMFTWSAMPGSTTSTWVMFTFSTMTTST